MLLYSSACAAMLVAVNRRPGSGGPCLTAAVDIIEPQLQGPKHCRRAVTITPSSQYHHFFDLRSTVELLKKPTTHREAITQQTRHNV